MLLKLQLVFLLLWLSINTAIAYAGQISKIEAVRRESYFDQGVRGLCLYGAKVIRPEALCTLYLSEGSE